MPLNVVRLAAVVVAAIWFAAPAIYAQAQTVEEPYESVEIQRSGTSRYVVRPGDTLYSIARSAQPGRNVHFVLQTIDPAFAG